MPSNDRRSYTVWLKPRHMRMLEELGGRSLGSLARRAIEETFESVNDREYVRLSVEDSLTELLDQWRREFRAEASMNVVSTNEGFRVVLVLTKEWRDG